MTSSFNKGIEIVFDFLLNNVICLILITLFTGDIQYHLSCVGPDYNGSNTDTEDIFHSSVPTQSPIFMDVENSDNPIKVLQKMSSNLTKLVTHVQLHGYKQLTELKQSYFMPFTSMTHLTVNQCGLKTLGSRLLAYNNGIYWIDLSHNELEIVMWQAFIGLHLEYVQLILNGNPLRCHCANEWLADFTLLRNRMTFVFGSGAGNGLKFQITPSDYFALPSYYETPQKWLRFGTYDVSEIADGNNLVSVNQCNKTLTQSCPHVRAQLNPLQKIFKLGTSVTVTCDLKVNPPKNGLPYIEPRNQIDGIIDNGVRYTQEFLQILPNEYNSSRQTDRNNFLPPNIEMRGPRVLKARTKNDSVVVTESESTWPDAKQQKSLMTLTVDPVQSEHIGLVGCQDYHALYPTYDVTAFAVEAPPILVTRKKEDTPTNTVISFSAFLHPRKARGWFSHLQTNFTDHFSFDNNDVAITSSLEASKNILITMMDTYYSVNVRVALHSFVLNTGTGDFTLGMCNALGCDQVHVTVYRPLGSEDKGNVITNMVVQARKEENLDMVFVMVLVSSVSVFTILCLTSIVCLWKVQRKCHTRLNNGRNTSHGVSQHELSTYADQRFYLLTDSDSNTTAYIGLRNSLKYRYIDQKSLTLVTELGRGAFGEVYKAYWNDSGNVDNSNSVASSQRETTRLVAVKLLPIYCPQSRREFEREVEVMSRLEHRNIIDFYGVSGSSCGDELSVVFEFMDMGDLKTYLRERCPQASKMRAATEIEPKPLELMDLLLLARQVGAGLSYLVKERVLHRDLAARNCLMSSAALWKNVPEIADVPLVKLCDFGMSRYIYSAVEYYKLLHPKTILPVRWLPPESLVLGKFLPESDIWSLGIVLWEIFTLGETPHPTMTNGEVLEAAKMGKTPGYPEKCPLEVWALMKRCWEQVPQERIPVHRFNRRLEEISMQHGVSESTLRSLLGDEFCTNSPLAVTVSNMNMNGSTSAVMVDDGELNVIS